MLKSPSPGAMSLSTPIPSSSISPTFVTLFEAIDIQTHSSPSYEHITKSLTSTIVVSEPVQLANPQTVDEATPLEFHEILDGISSGAVTTDAEGSPQNQEQGASANDNMETHPISKADTTTSGRNSDDPIKIGDELKYNDLTERMSNIETTVGEMKDLMKQLVDPSKSQPSHQQLSQELWKSV
ncbi:hypothetical protein Hanom_Chr06g00517481 [Helianthus anomalus]